MPREAQQRFVALDVGEVSLVDSPANEKEFAVVKSLNPEDTDMADATTNTEKNTETEVVTLETAKAANEAVEKAMEHVTSLVENIAKLAAANEADDEPEITKSEESAEGGEDDVEKGLTKEQKEMRGQMRQKLEKQMMGCGMKGDMLKKAVDVAMRTLAGQGAFMPGPNTKKPMKDTSKSVEDGAETEDVSKAEPEAKPVNQQELVQETIKQISQGLQGAQALSAPEAQEALKAAVETLQNLLKQVSMQQVPTGMMPKNTLPSNAMYGMSGIKEITKSLDGLKETLVTLQEAHKSINERLEDIEKTRQPDTSGGGADGTVTGTKKSLWAGIV